MVSLGDEKESWWNRIPLAGKVGTGVALVAMIGVIAASCSDGPAADVPKDTTTATAEETVQDEAPESGPNDSIVTTGPDETITATTAAIPTVSSTSGAVLRFALADREGPNYLCSIDQDREFTCEQIDGDYTSEDVAAADFNGDGLTDLAFANWVWEGLGGSAVNRVCLAPVAPATEWECSDIDSGRFQSTSIAAADLDGDGRVDLVIGNETDDGWTHPERAQVCTGDGTGSFECSTIDDSRVQVGPRELPAQALGVTDVDLDGHIDVVLAMGSAPNEACFGDGSGAFICSIVDDELADTRGVAIGDLDEDGFPDLYFANHHTPNRLCLADGAGGFDCIDVSTPDNSSLAATAADMNGDGHLDVLLGRGDTNESFDLPDENVDQLCLGDGQGGLVCSALPGNDQPTWAILPINSGYVVLSDPVQVCISNEDSYECESYRPDFTDDRGFGLPMQLAGLALLD